jgi:hypothetical protein
MLCPLENRQFVSRVFTAANTSNLRQATDMCGHQTAKERQNILKNMTANISRISCGLSYFLNAILMPYSLSQIFHLDHISKTSVFSDVAPCGFC